MDKASLIDSAHKWRRILSEDLYAASGGTVRPDDALQSAQRYLFREIMSRMLLCRRIKGDVCLIPKGLSDHLLENVSDRARLRIQREMRDIDFSQFPFGILIDIYESYLTGRLVLNRSTGRFDHSQEEGLRKGQGIYYTPLYVVSHIVDRTLRKYLWGNEGEGLVGKTPEEVSDLRILDPACGSGSFLAHAFDVLAEFYAAHGLRNRIDLINRNLYGIDMDGDAVGIAGAILTLKSLDLIGHVPDEMPQLNMKDGNFLISSPSDLAESRPFNWEKEMPEALAGGGFTMILGNPPYGAEISQAERNFVRSSYETWRSSDSSSLFIEKAVKMLKEDGILGFIVPKTLSYVVSWRPIREFLLKECSIVEIADASRAFRNVLLEQMVIIARRDGNPKGKTIVSTLSPEDCGVSHDIDSTALSADRFSIWLNNATVRGIVGRIWERSVPLGELVDMWCGLNIQSLPVFSDKPDPEHDHPCLRGRDIQRYYIRPEARHAMITGTVRRRNPSLERFHAPRIVAQDIIAHIKHPVPHIKITAAIDRQGDRINVNTVINMNSSEYDLEYLCGILNSRLISWYAYNFIYNRAVRTMHFQRGYADQIPIRRIDPDNPQDKIICGRLIEYVNRMMALCREEIPPKEEIAGLDTKIDELTCQLYGLQNEDMRFLRERAEFY